MKNFYGEIDHSELQKELIAAIGAQEAAGWYLVGAHGEVTFVATKPDTPDPTAIIEEHIANTFNRKINAAVVRIKQEASDIIRDTILNLGTEYQQAKEDADAFYAAGMTGPVPASIQSWADAKIPKQTAQWACQDIRTAADNWIGAQELIRQSRLKYQELTKAAADQDGIDAAYAGWTQFRAQMRQQLGV